MKNKTIVYAAAAVLAAAVAGCDPISGQLAGCHLAATYHGADGGVAYSTVVVEGHKYVTAVFGVNGVSIIHSEACECRKRR